MQIDLTFRNTLRNVKRRVLHTRGLAMYYITRAEVGAPLRPSCRLPSALRFNGCENNFVSAPTEGCGSLVETLALAAGLPKRTGPRQAAATPRMQRLTGYRNSESSTKSQLFKKRRGNFCQKQKLFLTLRHNGDMRFHACSKPPWELGWGMPGRADKSL